jgi:hypothetical protein
MHRFRSGQFEGLTIEQAMLRDAPALYDIVDCAQKNEITRLERMVRDFQMLRQKLSRASIHATCAQVDCQSPVRFMTLPLGPEGWNRPRPYYWCDRHKPCERSGVSPKQAVHFDAIPQMKTKREKQIMFRKLKAVLGIPTGAKMTEQFARDFFGTLG